MRPGIKYIHYYYLLPFCELHFHSVNDVFGAQKLLILMSYNLSIFSTTFYLLFKESLFTPKSQ